MCMCMCVYVYVTIAVDVIMQCYHGDLGQDQHHIRYHRLRGGSANGCDDQPCCTHYPTDNGHRPGQRQSTLVKHSKTQSDTEVIHGQQPTTARRTDIHLEISRRRGCNEDEERE